MSLPKRTRSPLVVRTAASGTGGGSGAEGASPGVVGGAGTTMGIRPARPRWRPGSESASVSAGTARVDALSAGTGRKRMVCSAATPGTHQAGSASSATIHSAPLHLPSRSLRISIPPLVKTHDGRRPARASVLADATPRAGSGGHRAAGLGPGWVAGGYLD